MAYNWLNIESPYFWLFWSGLFLGASINRLLRPTRRVDRWALATVYLAIALAAAASALIIPRIEATHAGGASFVPTDPGLRWLYFGCAAACAGFVAMRFKRSVGLPLLVAAAILAFIVGTGLRPFKPLLARGSEVGHFRLLSVNGEAMNVEVNVAGSLPVLGAIQASALAPMVRLVNFADYYFFLVAPSFYRLDGLAAFSAAARRSDHDLRLPDPTGHRVASAPRFPGIENRLIVASPVTPALLQDYVVTLDADRSVRVTRTVKQAVPLASEP